MSISLSEERDRIQQEVEELEQSLSVTHTELELLSSETGDESGEDSEEEMGQSAAGLLAQRDKIQKEIQNLENVLGPHSPVCVSDDDSSIISISSDESNLGLSPSVESCLQINLVYQQVVQETLQQLETLLTQNQQQQKEVLSQLSGLIKESSREERPPSSSQPPINMFLGRFLKPYFKDKLTGLGPPANQETKEKTSRMTGCIDNKKVKRWESWQKTLLIHSVSRDSLRRLIQPKLSKVDYLSQKLLSAAERDKQQLREQIESLEREIDVLRERKEEDLIGDRYGEHDWQKISNIDFEGTRDAEDLKSFWENFLHPSINKSMWSQEEVQQLKDVSRKYSERHWETIATELGTGRTAFMCLQTFQRFVSDSLRHCSWTADEDSLLRELVEKMRIGNFIPYTQMSYFMEGRDPAQLIYRWNNVLDPSLKKGPWSPEEDQLLLQAVSVYGEKEWWKIRMEVPGRHDGACRDRYFDCLKAGTKKGAFDKEETDLLLKLVEKHGVGRWAKIAAEIPHRNDAQCLREWRKQSRGPPPPAKKHKKPAKKKMERKTSAQKKIRRRLMKLKDEEEEEMREEEEMVVEYMDSDEEEKKNQKEAVEDSRILEVDKETVEEENEREYSFPPMQEWIPVEKPQSSTFLSFQPVELPSSGHSHKEKTVRSTILGQFGRSVLIGPPPTELPLEKHTSTLLMVTPDQLRVHLFRHVEKFRRPGRVPATTILGRTTNRSMEYKLQAAVIPWIGNLLIPTKSIQTTAITLREQGEKRLFSSTSIFLLLLQTMNIDSLGCKEMIEKRKKGVVFTTPPPESSSLQLKNPKTIAGMLQRRRLKKELQDFDLQHSLILEQLQQQQQKPLLRPVPPQQPPHTLHHPPSTHQKQPEILHQVPPHMPPQMTPALFPQAVLIQRSVPPSLGSYQLLPPSSLTPPAPAVAITFPFAVPPAPHTLPVPPLCGVPVSVNLSSPSSSSGLRVYPRTLPGPDAAVISSSCSPPSAPTPSLSITPADSTRARPDTNVLFTQNLCLATPRCVLGSQLTGTSTLSPAAPFHKDHDYTSCEGKSDIILSKPAKAPPQQKEQTGVEKKLCMMSSQAGQCDSGTSESVGGTATGVAVEGKRPRKLSERARALQEAAQVKAEAKKKRLSSSPHKKCSHLSAPGKELVTPNQLQTPLTSCGLSARQPMWVMAPAGLAQQAPPLGLQFTLVQSCPPSPTSSLKPPARTRSVTPNWHALSVPLNVPRLNLPQPLTAPSTFISTELPPGFILHPVRNPGSTPLGFSIPRPAPKTFLPYKGAVRIDSTAPPPLRKETVKFDQSLMFLDSDVAVCDWLSGQGGVVVPGAGVSLPYLPPFVSSLSTLGALLCAKRSLTKSALQLLCRGSEPRNLQTKPNPHDSLTETPSQPADLPDSTSEPTAASSISFNPQHEELEEAELVAAVRQLVAKRFSNNPAYQLLKARFLSCFTVPALLATIQPVTEETAHHRNNEEEEEEDEEDEEELKKIKEGGKQRRGQRSLLLRVESGAPANHFSGIANTTRATRHQTGPDQTGTGHDELV